MGSRIEWGLWRHRFRRVALVWTAVTLLMLLWAVLVPEEFPAVAVLNVVVAVLLLSGSRQGTAADAHGIEIAGALRVRRIPWDAVDELRPKHARTDRWTDLIPVEVHLTDGTRRTLPGVGPDDLPQLEELRTPATE